MQRYFVDKKENGSFILSQEQAHHILRVMRMNVKDEITICYNEEVYLCEITSTSPLTVQEKEKLHEDYKATYCNMSPRRPRRRRKSFICRRHRRGT